MTNPITPATIAACAVPVLALPALEMVINDMLREYAATDPRLIAVDRDDELLAGLAMILPYICGELLARRCAMEEGLA